MNLTTVKMAVRQDLFDPAGAEARWTDTDLERAIAKAVARYGEYRPYIAHVDIQSQPYQRTYPYPVPADPAYPVWWIERVLYPLQIIGTAFPAPVSAGSAMPGPGGSLGSGTYRYAVTLLSPAGETTPSPALTVTTDGTNRQITLSALPVGGVGSAGNVIHGRKIYRTMVDGMVFYLLTTVMDTVTTDYIDSQPDSVLSGRPMPPVVNTSGVMHWPPRKRRFESSSDLYEQTNTMGEGHFTLALSNDDLPRDSTRVMRIFYATGQRLDIAGSTIPEVHMDVIVLGASAYAMEAYQVPTNDNFMFQDGALSDRIDDTAIPRAWLEAAQQKLRRFERSLQEIGRQHDLGYRARVQWGDVPGSWMRL